MNRFTSRVSGMVSRMIGTSPESHIDRDFVSVRCIDEDKIAPMIYDVPKLNRALRRELGFPTQDELQAEYVHMDPEVFGGLVDTAIGRLAGRAALYSTLPTQDLKI